MFAIPSLFDEVLKIVDMLRRAGVRLRLVVMVVVCTIGLRVDREIRCLWLASYRYRCITETKKEVGNMLGSC